MFIKSRKISSKPIRQNKVAFVIASLLIILLFITGLSLFYSAKDNSNKIETKNNDSEDNYYIPDEDIINPDESNSNDIEDTREIDSNTKIIDRSSQVYSTLEI